MFPRLRTVQLHLATTVLTTGKHPGSWKRYAVLCPDFFLNHDGRLPGQIPAPLLRGSKLAVATAEPSAVPG